MTRARLEADAARITALANSLGRTPSADALEPLTRYVALVRTWSQKLNLVSAGTDEELAEILFADALVLADPELVPLGSRLVDVGAGAGAPSVPLLVMRPDLSATCVEPRQKRATFLRNAGQRLDLGTRLVVIEQRLDPAAPACPGAPFDVALSRATFAPPAWLTLGAALAPRVIVMTARATPPEAPADMRVAAEARYALPVSGAERRATAYVATRRAVAETAREQE